MNATRMHRRWMGLVSAQLLCFTCLTACTLLAPGRDEVALGERPSDASIGDEASVDGGGGEDVQTDAPRTTLVLPPEGQYYVRGKETSDAGAGSEKATLVLGNDATGSPVQGFSNPFFLRIRSEGECSHIYVCPSQKHSEHFKVCKTDAAIQVAAANQRMVWNILGNNVKTGIDLTCDLGDLLRTTQTVGAKWALACRGTVDDTERTVKVVAEGEHTYLGLESVTIDGTEHLTHHLREVRKAAGDDGASAATFKADDTMDFWLDKDTGLPLESTRSTTSSSSKPDAVLFQVKSMVYEMRWGFQMVSTVPSKLPPLGDAGLPTFDCTL